MPKAWKIALRTEPSVLRQVLRNRNVAEDQLDAFLYPDWERDSFSHTQFTHMPAAVARLYKSLEAGEPIVIHGDYDADGVSGTTLLYSTLREICEFLKYPFSVTAFLPDREKDGYGVALHTVERLAQQGTKLLITVDCGIANGLELNRAHELGMDAIVCDHHQMGQHYPDKAIVLHPLAPGEQYPNKFLCGTGVAFKFASALLDEARKRGAPLPVGHEKWLLDLVAVATVTDVMPLLGENRTLEHFGLKVLQRTRRPGLKAILQSSGTDIDTVDTGSIGFRIGPRLNAAGRLASAELAFKTLAATTDAEAREAAFALERLNRERQQIFSGHYEEACALADELRESSNVLVVASDTWLPGIVGLIAGRLVGDYSLPAFAFTKVGDHYVGSGRSLGGLHLVEAMNACGDDIFVKRGGHPQACGLTLKTREGVDIFREKVNAFAAKYFGGQGVQDELVIDAEVPLTEATWELFEDLAKCAPFGEGNRRPVFAARTLRVIGADVMGSSGSHLRLTVVPQDGGMFRLVGFNMGNLARQLPLGSEIDVAYELESNTWNGKVELQYRLVDVQVKNDL